MKIMRQTLLAFILFTSLAAPAQVNFEELSCRTKGFSHSSFKVTTTDSSVDLAYEDRTSDLQEILKSLLPSGISANLLEAYHCIELKLKLPISDCQPTSNKLEHFTCDATNISFTVTGKLSCYDTEAGQDVYKGNATAVSLKTSKTFIKDDGYFGFNLKLGSENTVGSSYNAHYWYYEGNKIAPDCTVDDYLITYKK